LFLDSAFLSIGDSNYNLFLKKDIDKEGVSFFIKSSK